MQIILRKLRGKPSVLICERNDSSTAWQNYGNQSAFFPIHDLAHYAVERQLGFKQAFFGLIDGGMSPDDFAKPEVRNLPDEAMFAEFLAGLLTTTQQVRCGLTFDEIREAIAQQCASSGIAIHELTDQTLVSIQAEIKTLRERWGAIEDEGDLVLPFE